MVTKYRKKVYRKPTTKVNLVKLQRDVRQLKSYDETKYYDYTITGESESATTNAFEIFSAIVQGTERQQRVGLKIHVIGIYFSYIWVWPVSDGYNLTRMTFAQAKAGGTGLVTADFINGNVQSNFALTQNNEKMNVHYEKIIAGSCVSSNFNKIVRGTKYIKFNKTIGYDDATAIPKQNPLYFAICSDSVIINHPTCSYNIRVMYKDS